MLNDDSQFAESIEYQLKVLSLMLDSHQFCIIASDALKSEQFSDKALAWYFNRLANAHPRLTTVTLKEELMRAVKAGSISADHISRYVEIYDVIKVPPLPEEEEHIRTSLGKFIRKKSISKAILEAAPKLSNDLNDEEWQELEGLFQGAFVSGMDVSSLGQNYFTEFKARLDRRINRDPIRRLSTGIPTLDELLGGGIKNKQLGLIVGGTGRGKSIFLQWLGRTGVLLGKKVVYITLELPEDVIAERYDSMYSRVQPQMLHQKHTTVNQELAPLSTQFANQLWIKEYPAQQATVNTIRSYLQQLIAAGHTPDVVLVDYLDLLKPTRTYGDAYRELDLITMELHGLAKSLDTSIWTATQLNRAGLVAETPDEASIAGSIGKLYTADISLFMAQTKDERELDVMRLVMAKNRNGPAGRSIEIDTDYNFMTFYREPVDLSENDEEESDGQ